jgi:membrane protein implicated in regulation of membrane protease activity
MASLVKPAVLARLPHAQAAVLVGRRFFPGLIASPFMTALHVVFWFSLIVSLIAAFASLLRGKRYVHEEEN